MPMVLTFEHLRDIGLLPGGTPPAAPPARPMEEPVKPPKAAENGSADKGKAGKKAEKGKAKAEAAPPTPQGPVEPVAEKTEAELAKMSKAERTAYHTARRAAQQQQQQKQAAGGEGADATASGKQALTKAQRRAIQEAQRKAKEEKKDNVGEFEELLKDLKLQGLTEQQAREVIAQMKNSEAVEDDDEEEEEEAPQDFHSCVADWMGKQEAVTKGSLHDFNMGVRFQGHVETTPPDHLREVLAILCEQACAGCDLTSPKLQPMAVAKKAEPLMRKWAPLMQQLYEKIDDALESAEVVVQAAFAGVSAKAAGGEGAHAGVVGCLMAVREIDMIEDMDLQRGCKNCEQSSVVLDKFIEFLEDDEDGSDDDDED